MVKDIRLKRLERVALQRASEVVLRELSDPRLVLVTLTRVELAADLSYATIYWSSLGSQADRNKTERALRDAVPVVQAGVAEVFHTRRSPRIKFQFDPSIEGAVKMGAILSKLESERAPSEGSAPDASSEPPAPPSADPSANPADPATSEEE